MTSESYDRRLSDRLKNALDDLEKIGSREELAERLRELYKTVLEEEAQYSPSRRAADRTHAS